MKLNLFTKINLIEEIENLINLEIVYLSYNKIQEMMSKEIENLLYLHLIDNKISNNIFIN